jgi:hypothetical protein
VRVQLPGQRSVGIEQPALPGVPDRAVTERLLHAHAGPCVRSQLDPRRVARGAATAPVPEPFDVVGVVLRPEADDDRAPTAGGDRAQIPRLRERASLGHRVGRTGRVPGDALPGRLQESDGQSSGEDAAHGVMCTRCLCRANDAHVRRQDALRGAVSYGCSRFWAGASAPCLTPGRRVTLFRSRARRLKPVGCQNPVRVTRSQDLQAKREFRPQV